MTDAPRRSARGRSTPTARPAEIDRDTLAAQTGRNLAGMELERAGRLEEALRLYEQNVADGFEGDWPYGRLVAHFEKAGRLDQAQRVLERAIAVFTASKRRTAEDRKATLAAFRGRLRLVKKAAKSTRLAPVKESLPDRQPDSLPGR